MAAVHFPQYLANLTQPKDIESHIVGEIRPCTNNIVYARFENFRSFMRVLWAFFRGFVR